MLGMAREQFCHALSLEGTKHAEPWIYHYMMGKVLWKMGRTRPSVVLDHFLQVPRPSTHSVYIT